MFPRPIVPRKCCLLVLSAMLALQGGARAAELAAAKATVLGGALTLEQAYDCALATDQSIRIAYWEVRKANLLPWSALSKLGPQINASGSYNLASRAGGELVDMP